MTSACETPHTSTLKSVKQTTVARRRRVLGGEAILLSQLLQTTD